MTAMNSKTIRKALAATVFGAVSALGTAMLDGALTGTELIASAGFGLVAGAGVWRIPNATAKRAQVATGKVPTGRRASR